MEASTSLGRDSIVEAALAITGEHGLPGLTMRALASRFGVTPMALYRHVSDREELVRLVADQIGALVRPETTPDMEWDDRARAWAVTQRTVLRRFPGVAAWLMDNGPAGPEAYRLLELLASTLADAGFDDTTVARGTASIMSWTFSRVSIEDGADVRRDARRPSRAQAFISGLEQVDATAHPTSARMGRAFFTLSMAEIFDTGLDWILAGLAADAPPTSPR